MAKMSDIKTRVAAAKAPSARRNYSGPYNVTRANVHAKGTLREAMVRVVTRCATVERAEASFAKTEFGKAGKKLDWPFLLRNGYVQFNGVPAKH